jgi:hypothetical protein
MLILYENPITMGSIAGRTVKLNWYDDGWGVPKKPKVYSTKCKAEINTIACLNHSINCSRYEY